MTLLSPERFRVTTCLSLGLGTGFVFCGPAGGSWSLKVSDCRSEYCVRRGRRLEAKVKLDATLSHFGFSLCYQPEGAFFQLLSEERSYRIRRESVKPVALRSKTPVRKDVIKASPLDSVIQLILQTVTCHGVRPTDRLICKVRLSGEATLIIGPAPFNEATVTDNKHIILHVLAVKDLNLHQAMDPWQTGDDRVTMHKCTAVKLPRSVEGSPAAVLTLGLML
ncbi:hypothetical protein PAMP_011038 [Pampus punctatissimus]